MLFSVTLQQGIVACGVVAAGATVQASVGFGLALVAAPILLLVDPTWVPGPLLFSAVALALLVVLRERRSIDVTGLKWALAGRFVGTIPAAFVVAALPERAFSIVFAVLILAAILLSVVGIGVRATDRTVLLAGMLSGFMATISSVGGPPVALVFQHAAGPRIRGTLAGFFICGSGLSLVALATVGRFGLPELALSVSLLPGVLAGFVISKWTAPVMDRGAIRPFVLILSFASGAAVLVRALF